MGHDFVVGNLVSKNPDYNPTDYRFSELNYGVIYEVIQVENNGGSILLFGGDLEANHRNGGNSRNDEVRERLGNYIWNVESKHIIYAGECNNCKHSCKMSDKCGLYEE